MTFSFGNVVQREDSINLSRTSLKVHVCGCKQEFAPPFNCYHTKLHGWRNATISQSALSHDHERISGPQLGLNGSGIVNATHLAC